MGCKYCDRDVDNENILHEKTTDKNVINENELFVFIEGNNMHSECYVKLANVGAYVEINYCPMCGTELKKEDEIKDDKKYMDKKVNIHKEICEKMNETYRTKNNDYGDSYTRVREEHKDLILIHLKEKLMRLDALYKGTEQLVNESVEDTLMDMANYCILELIELRNNHDSK